MIAALEDVRLESTSWRDGELEQDGGKSSQNACWYESVVMTFLSVFLCMDTYGVLLYGQLDQEIRFLVVSRIALTGILFQQLLLVLISLLRRKLSTVALG